MRYRFDRMPMNHDVISKRFVGGLHCLREYTLRVELKSDAYRKVRFWN